MIPILERLHGSRDNFIQCGHDPFDCQNVFESPSVSLADSDGLLETLTCTASDNVPQSSGIESSLSVDIALGALLAFPLSIEARAVFSSDVSES
jgi:hypothetical protein